MAGNLYDEALEQAEAPKAKPSIYDTILSDESKRQESNIRQSVKSAATTSPDTAAEARRMALKFGVPSAAIERDFDSWKQRDAGELPYAELQKETPALAEWLQDSENAKVSSDDLEQLGLLEYIAKAPARSFAATRAQQQFAELRYESIFRSLTAEENDQLLASKFHMNDGGATKSWFRKAIKGTGSFLANQVPVVEYAAAGALTVGAVGAAGGSVLPGVGTVAGGVAGLGYGARAGALYGVLKSSFVQETGLAFDDFSNMKDEFGQALDPNVARLAALAVGAVNAPIEAGAQELLLKSIPGLDKLGAGSVKAAVRQALRVPSVRAGLLEAAKSYGTTLTGETAQEVAQQAVNILAGEIAKSASGQNIPHITPGEAARDLVSTAGEAAASFALGVGAGPAMQTARTMRLATEASKGVEFFTALGEGAADSKTIQRQPEAARTFLENVMKDGPVPVVYAPVDTFRTYWQGKGLDPATVAEEVTGEPGAFERALQTGEDLAIPTARYATTLAGTEHNAFFANELRLAPDAMNGREVDLFHVEQEQVKAKEQAEGQRLEATTSPVRAQIMGALESAGTDTTTAGRYAALYEGIFGGGGLADRAGVDATAQFERYGLQVARPDLDVEGSLYGGVELLNDAELTAALDSPNLETSIAAGREVLRRRKVAAETPAPAGTAAAPEAIPGLDALSAGLEGASITAAPEGSTSLNASGESDASGEAIARQRDMKAGSKAFVKFDRAGTMTPLVDVGAQDYKTQPGETFGVLTSTGFEQLENRGGKVPANVTSKGMAGIAQPADEAQNAGADGGAEAGKESAGRDGERGRHDAGVGNAEGSGDGTRTESRRLPSTIELAGEPAFRREHASIDRARLTPEVTQELQRIGDELSEFGFVERSWAFLDKERGLEGNAAGGHAQVTAGAAGAPVYHDILTFAPLNAGVGTEKAKSVEGTRGEVAEAIAAVLAGNVIASNLAEGAVRVAERRAANDYRELSRPVLPPSWGQEVPEHFIDDLGTAIETELTSLELSAAQLEAEGGDTSFDPSEWETPADVSADASALEQAEERLRETSRAYFAGEVDEPTYRQAVADVDVLQAAVPVDDGSGDQTFYQSKKNADGTYQSDLFGNDLPGAGTEDAAAGDGSSALQRDDVPELVAPTRTHLVEHTKRKIGRARVITPEHAAEAMAYLAKGAQERFDGLVTDDVGKPIAIVGSFKGTVSETTAAPSITLAEAYRIKGAANLWLVHNHPSGEPALSDADFAVLESFSNAMRGTGIKLAGIMAIGSGEEGKRQFEHRDAGDLRVHRGTVTTSTASVTVPAVEREFATTAAMESMKLQREQDVINIVPGLAGSSQFGAVLLNAKNQPIGYLPMDATEARELRVDGRLDKLIRATSISAPAQVVLRAANWERDQQAADNVARAFASLGIPVLDISTKTASGAESTAALVTGRRYQVQGKMFKQGERGSITFGQDRKFRINLFANADLSTFLHESGHFYLEVFGDLVDGLLAQDAATLTPSQQGVVSDYRQVLEFLGVESRQQIGRPEHEKFARAFEAYLFEGKAPSMSLREAFSAFRAWLLGIYRQLKALNVELTPEVRGVFDRMLASDDAIAAAEAEAHVAPMFIDARAAGMNAEEFELYRKTVADASRKARELLDQKLADEVQREQSAQWKAQREAIESTVRAEANEAPVYQALAAMRTGKQPEGGELEAGQPAVPMKLSRKILVFRFGADRLKRLPKPYIYSSEGGLDPDVVAQRFGFSSADAMLSAIETAPPYQQTIEQETNRRMIEANGSMLLDGSVIDEARESVENDYREEIIRKEMQALGRLRAQTAPFTRIAKQSEQKEREYERRWLEAEAKLRIAIAEGRKQVEIDALRDDIRELQGKSRRGGAIIRGAIPPANVLRDVATRRIEAMTLEQIKPAAWFQASRRAAQKAILAAARQDFDEAITAKRDELLNLALYRRALTVTSDLEARVKKAQQLSTPAARARLGTAGDSYLDQVDGILDRYELARVSGKVLERRAAIVKWVAALEGEGLPVDLPEELMNDARRVNYRKVTTLELQGVLDGIDQILHLVRLKNRLLKSAEKRELDAVAGGLASSIREHAGKAPAEVARDRRASGEKARVVADFFAGHRKLASLLREMDGFEDGGAAWSAIMLPLNEAADREATMTADATKRFTSLVESAFPGRKKAELYTKVEVKAIGRSLSRMERLMIALNWGNDGNRDRLRNGEKWSDEQVQAVLDTLTANDAKFVQGVFDFINGYWSEIEAKQKRVTGLAPTKVQSARFTVAGVELAGGYFPLKYDDRLSAKALGGLELDAANLAKQAAYAHATTKRGHTQERAAHGNMPIRLDFGVMFEHVAQVIHDLSHHEALIDVGRILGHGDVSSAILEKHGDIVYRQIKGSVRDVAFGTVPATNGFERAINYVRTGATVVGLGWNVFTAAMQPLGLANSIHRIGPKWVGRGLARWFRNPKAINETVDWIYDRSEFMKNRGRTQQREISEIRNAVGVNTGRLSGWIDDAISTATFDHASRQGVADSYFWMIQRMQQLVDVPTWLGAYEKAMELGESEHRSIHLADQAVLDSQGGGQVKDLAQVQRGGPMMKLWTNFYSFFNVLHNQAVESHRRTNYRNPAEVGRLAADYMVLFIAPAILSYALRAALRPGDGDDPDAMAWRLPFEVVSYISGTMLGFREVSGALQGAYGYEGPAGARAFAALSRLGQQVKQGELDEAFFKALNDVAGTVLHYPAGQVRRTLDGIQALDEGKTANPLAVVFGAPSK